LNIWGLERDPRRWPLTITTTRLLFLRSGAPYSCFIQRRSCVKKYQPPC
jgi:hypothetical protein